MTRQKVAVSRSGSWGVCILLLMFLFPIGVLYWMFKMRKTKTYEYERR